MTNLKIISFTIIFFSFTWINQGALSGKIKPNQPSNYPAYLYEKSKGKMINPLWTQYEIISRTYNVDLSHADYVYKSRRTHSLWGQQAYSVEHFEEEKFDVVIIGDSTATWGLDTKTISNVSGLSVGLLGFESNLLTDFTVEFYKTILQCIMKPKGLIVASWALHHQRALNSTKRFWNDEQYKVIKLNLSDCKSLKKYVKLQRDKENITKLSMAEFKGESLFSYAIWRKYTKQLNLILEAWNPFWSAKIRLADYFSSNKNSANSKDPHDLLNVQFLKTVDSDTVTLVGNFTKKARLGPVNKVQSITHWSEEMKHVNVDIDNGNKLWKNNLGHLDSLNSIGTVCMLSPIEHDFRFLGLRYYTWLKWMKNSCFIDLPAIVGNELGLDSLIIQSGDHVGNESGQLVSIALGKAIRAIRNNKNLSANIIFKKVKDIK